jgi:two-component system sensor histidine kinase KdpD
MKARQAMEWIVREHWRRYLVSGAGVAGATAVLGLLRAEFGPATIALLYLLVVLGSAMYLGRGAAIIASLLAFGFFNFFFVPPYYSLSIAQAQDVVRLLAFLAVAVIVSTLAGRATQQALAAQQRADELGALYSLSQLISAEVDLQRVLPTVARMTAQLLDVPICTVLIYDAEGRLREGGSYGAPPERAKYVDTFLRVGQRVLGVLRLSQRAITTPFTRAEQERIETIAAQTVLVLERARLAQEAGHTRALAESDRLKATLLSSVSHDLRTPLAIIKGAATNLLQDDIAWDGATRHELLTTIRDETDRLNRLVGNLLEMSRIEAGALQQTRGWQHLGDLVTGVVERLQGVLAGHALSVDLPDDLPLVAISYAQIEQVLTNLLENAARYSAPGTSICVRARALDGQVQVEVLDQGPGIPASLLPHIFGKFVRGVDPERHAGGSGLGLAICKGLIEAHGGQIWAENRSEGGTRVAFTLPLRGPGLLLPLRATNGGRQEER